MGLPTRPRTRLSFVPSLTSPPTFHFPFFCTFPHLVHSNISVSLTLVYYNTVVSIALSSFILPRPAKFFSKQSRCRAPPGQAALPSQPSKPLLGQPKPALLRNYLQRRQHPFRSRLPRNVNCRSSKTSTTETDRRQLRRKAHPRKLCD